MRIVIQRVDKAEVSNENNESVSICHGLVLLVGYSSTDTLAVVSKCIQKILRLRIFNDENGKMNLSVADVNGSVLVVPNFTLASSIVKGNRPSFDTSMLPSLARTFYNQTIELLRNSGLVIYSGYFGQHMKVSISNDGPVTFVIDEGAFNAS